MDKKNQKTLREEIKAKYLIDFIEFLKSKNEEVLRVGSAELAIPVLNSENEEDWLVITLKVPTGSRDGDAYDGYSMAQEYELKCADKVAKAKIQAEKKAKKIAKDQKLREQKAKAKAEHSAKANA